MRDKIHQAQEEDSNSESQNGSDVGIHRTLLPLYAH
jgi:hypothetical protein